MTNVPITVAKSLLDDVNSYKDQTRVWDDITGAIEKVYYQGQDALSRKHAKNLYSTRINQEKRLVFLKTDTNEFIPVCYARDHDKYEAFLDNAPPSLKEHLHLEKIELDVHHNLAQAVDDLNDFDFERLGPIAPPSDEERQSYEEQQTINRLLQDEETFGFVADAGGTTAYFFNMNYPAVIKVDEAGLSTVRAEAPSGNTQAFNRAADNEEMLEHAISHFEQLQEQTAQDNGGDFPQVAEGGLDATISLFNNTHSDVSPLTAYASKSVQDSTPGYLKKRFNELVTAKTPQLPAHHEKTRKPSILTKAYS